MEIIREKILKNGLGNKTELFSKKTKKNWVLGLSKINDGSRETSGFNGEFPEPEPLFPPPRASGASRS